MIDLDKEFRTLRLLGSAMMVIGAGLAVAGFGFMLFMHDKAMDSRSRTRPPYTESAPQPAAPGSKNYNEKLTTSVSNLSVPTGVLGLLFVGLGWVLRWIIRNNIDDGDTAQDNPELFKAYAQQLVIAEKQRAKERKRRTQI